MSLLRHTSVLTTHRRALRWVLASAALLVSGNNLPVGTDAPVDDDMPSFDIDQVPDHVLDDGTVIVTDAGIIIEEPEPFAGWPAELVEYAVGIDDDPWRTDDRHTSEAPSISQAFALHSRPGADQTIYLDFNGHTTTGTEWNKNGRPSSFTSAPYSRDSSAGFSSTELTSIVQIWEQVAEDFAPFDVNVTTSEPAFDDLWRSSYDDTTYGTRVVISPTSSWYGNAGGVAYVGSFSWANERSSNGTPVVTPAFVFSNTLAGGVAKYVAEAVAHEVGHTLNLYHDGMGNSGYYSGHAIANGPSSGGWAPIMGVGYLRDVTQWSNGGYPGATQTQDDLTILASRLGWATSASSTAGTAQVRHGESIVGTVGKGSEDIEVVVTTGVTSISIRPEATHSNLLVSAQLLHGANVIASATPSSPSDWQLDFSEALGAGVYTVRMTPVGWGSVAANSLNGFSAYGSLGQFRISVNVAPSSTTPKTFTPPARDDCLGEARSGLMGLNVELAAPHCYSLAQRLG